MCRRVPAEYGDRVTSDDSMFLVFMAAGVAVLALIVLFGVLSGRKKRAATSATWTVAVDYLAGREPFFSSSSVEMSDKRQWELWRERFAVGSPQSVTLADETAEPTPRTLHIGRVGRELRAGWPQAKYGFVAYFAEFENSGLPCEFQVKATKKIVVVECAAEGVVARDAEGNTAWQSNWSELVFSNGPDLILSNGKEQIRVQPQEKGYKDLEALAVKYGTLRQMHF